MDPYFQRLASFRHWHCPSVSPLILSRCGFYYSGYSNVVICHICQLKFDSWHDATELFQQHLAANPSCPCSDPGNNGSFPVMSDETRHTVSSHSSELNSNVQNLSVTSNNQRSCPDFILLRSEIRRLETFHMWPSAVASVVDKHELAKAGLFYTGKRDQVQCAFCRGKLRNWYHGQRPVDRHRSRYPKCAFIQGRDDIGNIQISSSDMGNGALASSGNPSSSPQNIVNRHLDTGAHEPKHPQYADISERVHSFRGHTVGTGQTAEGLADAGFFYIGPTDNVRCFQCDGGLKNWQPADDPWTEHARCFPQCPFLLARSQQELIIDQNFGMTDVSVLGAQMPHHVFGGSISDRYSLSEMNQEKSALITDEDSLVMLEQNRQLKETQTCKVCMDQEIDIVFLPCGHLVCCSNCSPALRNCAICRALIRGTVKIFLN